jgi:thiol-disulfide isomerase/thioredoxin
MPKKIFLIFSLFLILFSNTYAQVRLGVWRAEIPTIIGNLPFHLKFEKNGGKLNAFTINGDESLKFDTVFVKNDSIHLKMLFFDAELIAKVNDTEMNGVFRKIMSDLSVRQGFFKAKFNDTDRFKDTDTKTIPNINGKYAIEFSDGKDKYEAIGVFNQTNKKVKGTFLTNTGDYRYLEGNVTTDSLMLSCFEGNHVFLFKAKIVGDSLVGGRFCSNLKYVETWKGIKNLKATLPDANTLTYLKPGFNAIDFSYPDFNGQLVSFKDAKFKNKVVIVQVLGSWCPNCMDETKFLANFYKKNRKKGVEVVGLAFEKSLEATFVNPRIEKLKARFGVEYPILIAGKNIKADASEKLPMLNKIISFPTTIIIDKKGIVRQIHTGFSGPGTGIYYMRFVENFGRFIEKLLQE